MPNKFGTDKTRLRPPYGKFKNFVAGLRFAVRHDYAVAYKLILTIVAPLVFLFLNSQNLIMILLATAFMFSAELFNTAVEALCDYVQPEMDHKIGAIKDMAAAATGMAIIIWWVLMGYELVLLGKRFYALWIIR